MLRIYITDNGIEGYNEGCSCCSSTEVATYKDIRKLINELDDQKSLLSLLAEMLEDYTENEITYWHRTYQSLRRLEMEIEWGKAYAENNKISGTAYKNSFDKLDENKKLLSKTKREYNTFPAVFKKYIRGYYKYEKIS